MKRELSVVDSFDTRPRRGRALDQLFSDFLRDRPMSMGAIDEMWECLTPEERCASFDSVAILRMRTFLAEGKPVQAYQTLATALRSHPTNLSLLLERTTCLSNCHEHLDRLFAEDPQSPLIAILYDFLLREAYLNPISQGRYSNYLAHLGKYAEAAKLALPLIALYPAMVGLRDTVEEIVIHLPDATLRSYASASTVSLARHVIKTEIQQRMALELTKQFSKLQEQIQTNVDDPSVNKILHNVLGEFSELSSLDVAFKDFYFLKAIADSGKGRHWDAIMLLQNLVEIDPCNLFFRRSLEIEVHKFTDVVVKNIAKNEQKIDLRRAYPVLREISNVPYILLKEVCLSEVASGNLVSAKTKMDHLCELNPFDSDYVLAALDVAIEAKDHDWMERLQGAMEKLKTERPWDLRAAAFETERSEASEITLKIERAS